MDSTQQSQRAKSRYSTGRQPLQPLGLHEKKQQPQVSQSDIHQLKIKTSYLDQQTKILRTQLNRVHDQISSKTKAINKTVTNTHGGAVSNTSKTRIEQLERSIKAAKDTKEKLEEQLDTIKVNDKGTMVIELQEELKMAYCELQRIQESIKDAENNGSDNVRKLNVANSKVSNEYTRDIEYRINKYKLSNKDIKDKIISFYRKFERNNIERSLIQRDKEGKTLDYGKVEIEDNKRYRIEKYNLIASELNDQSTKFEEKVKILNDVINSQREKIVNYLIQQSPRKTTSRKPEEEEQATERSKKSKETGEVDINF